MPSDAEWTTLVNFLGGSGVAGGKLKSTSSLWTAPNTGATNESGFSGLPGGYRNLDGAYYSVGGSGYWWSSTEYSTADAWSRTLLYYNGDSDRSNYGRQSGFS
ncbi:MAG: FISUMP domain-containing protein, partial [bacterium]